MKVRRNLLIALSLLSLSANAQRIKGSDTVLPVAQQTAERFMNLQPDARVTVTGGGTGVGISALMDNTTDIAMASRPIKFSEKMKTKEAGQEVDEVIVAYDALAVVVHPSNPVKQLTRQQLEDIFRGKITNWKQVGGDDRKIVVYSRETSSGTYEFFKENVLKNKNYMAGSLSMPSSNPSARRKELSDMSAWLMYLRAPRRFPYHMTEATMPLRRWRTQRTKLIPSSAPFITTIM